MAETVDVYEAQLDFWELLQRAEQGEQIVLVRNGRPLAVLSPCAAANSERAPGSDGAADQPSNGAVPPRRRRIPGIDKGRIWIAPDFDAPLPEFEEWEERSIFPDLPDAK